MKFFEAAKPKFRPLSVILRPNPLNVAGAQTHIEGYEAISPDCLVPLIGVPRSLD